MVGHERGVITIVNIYSYEGEYIYIGRSGCGVFSVLGNPIRLPDESKRDEVLDQHLEYLRNEWRKDNSQVKDEILRLASIVKAGEDLTLGCFCCPKKCHGDNIKLVINTLLDKGLV